MTIMFIIAWMCFYSIKTVKKSKTMFYIPTYVAVLILFITGNSL